MQAKRIFSLLLIVVLTLTCGAMSVSAQDNAKDFAYAVEVSSSTAIANDPCFVKPGDIVDVSVTVTANPGIKMMKFALNYDATALAPVLTEDNAIKFTSGKLFGAAEEQISFDADVEGKIWYFVDALTQSQDMTATGTVITFSFKVKDGFHGDTGITLSNYKKNVGGGTIAGVDFDSVTAADANTADYKKATITTHTYGDPVIVEATCQNAGTKTYTCTVEGCTAAPVVIETSPILAHNSDKVLEGKDATCTETGLTAGKACSMCGAVQEAQTEIPALGHNYGEWVVDKEPTTEAEGSKSQTCSLCGDKKTESIAKLEPTPEPEPEPEKDNTVVIVIASVAGALVLGVGGFCLYWFVFKKKI